MKKLGVYTLDKIDEHFRWHFYQWINDPVPAKVDYTNSIPESLQYLFNKVEGKTAKPAAVNIFSEIDREPVPRFSF